MSDNSTNHDLRVLAEVLRAGPGDPRLPVGPRDFRHCGMALAKHLWEGSSQPPLIYDMDQRSALRLVEAEYIFGRLVAYSLRMSAAEAERSILPQQLAEAIDAYLAGATP